MSTKTENKMIAYLYTKPQFVFYQIWSIKLIFYTQLSQLIPSPCSLRPNNVQISVYTVSQSMAEWSKAVEKFQLLFTKETGLLFTTSQGRLDRWFSPSINLFVLFVHSTISWIRNIRVSSRESSPSPRHLEMQELWSTSLVLWTNISHTRRWI